MTTKYFDLTSNAWNRIGDRPTGQREYGPSVMYDTSKILYVGGGGGGGGDAPAPTNAAEIIDLDPIIAAPSWVSVGNMKFARRQHNATILPDGTVLVTGGTRGVGFNSLSPGSPVHEAELWNPRRIGKDDEWTELAAECIDRCYHSTAILLPDARVLSAGGGEYSPDNNGIPNRPADSHFDGQIFSPPYLFRNKLPRPTIVKIPSEVTFEKTFEVVTAIPEQVKSISLIRLSSVTHSFNQNQRFIAPDCTMVDKVLKVTAPSRSNCPPGHYMLFVLNTDDVPSVASIIRVHDDGM